MSSKQSVLAIIFLFAFLAIGKSDSKPIMVIELIRHGARAAFAPIWDTTKAWDGLYGELTNAGMRMHYLLGQSVAKDYPELLGTYDPSQISVYSTDVNRTIMSAYSHLYGMFNPGVNYTLTPFQNGTALPPGLENQDLSEFIKDGFALPNGIRPIPVHIVARFRDYFLSPETGCTNFNNISQGTLNSTRFQEFKTIMNSTTKLIEDYSKQFNVPLSDIWSYQSLADVLIANWFENIPFPVNITYGSKEWHDLMFYNNWVVSYMYTGQNETLKISAVNLFDRMFTQLRGKLNGTFDKKFALHSAHDTTLMPMLATLGLVTTDCLRDVYLGKLPEHECAFPEYSANIITELYNDTAKPYVKFRYNGNYKNICNTTDFTCDLDVYEQLVRDRLQNYTTADYIKDCGISSQVDPTPQPTPTPDPNPSNERTTLIVFVVLIGVVVVIEVIVLIMFLLKKKGKEITDMSRPADQSLISQP